MNNKPLITLLSIFCLFVAKASKAQQIFSEGTLIYKVAIEPPANTEGLEQHTGTYTIIVKNNQLKKELKLDNGFVSTIITDISKNTSYSLRKIGNNFYAVQLDESAANNKKRFADFKVKEGIEKKKLAGYDGSRATVVYKDGSSADIFYVKDLKPVEFLLEWFPGIEGLPIAFERKNDDGMLMHFTAQSIATTPVESHIFKLPTEYKIISNEEYRKLMK
jgi:hypothetical protein